MKLNICCFLIGLVWIVSTSISLPMVIYVELQPSDNGQVNCQVTYLFNMNDVNKNLYFNQLNRKLGLIQCREDSLI